MHVPLPVWLLILPVLMSAPALQGEEALQQAPISVKGSQGLPKTLYIAPWKRLGKPLGGGDLEGDVGQETDPVERGQLQWELQLFNEGYTVDQERCPDCSARHPGD
jgi:hypothetical protein